MMDTLRNRILLSLSDLSPQEIQRLNSPSREVAPL